MSNEGQDQGEHETSELDVLTNLDVVRRLDRLWSKPKSANFNPLSPDLDGVKIGSYVIERVVGRGSFGIIYKARDQQLDRSVALKIPRPEVLIDKDRLRRFEVEALASAKLDHPGIVPVYDADLNADPPYIASAFCSGPNLTHWIEENRRVGAPAEAISLVMQLAMAVQHAHDNGVIHRDLKPSNVMLVSPVTDQIQKSLDQYLPRLTDFGLARLTQTELAATNSSMVLGTPMYMAPEQAECRFEDVGPATDVFSLGVILFELLTGEPPFGSDNYASLLLRLREDTPTAVSEFRPDVDKDINAICWKCLERYPRDRYEKPHELAQDLQKYLNRDTISARPIGWMDRFRRWSCSPSHLSDLCFAFIVISLIRGLFSIAGIVALQFSDAIALSNAEIKGALFVHGLLTAPLEFALIWAARLNQKRQLFTLGYWSVLLTTSALFVACLFVSVGFLPPPVWYQRMPDARATVFCLMSLLFAAQAFCWYLADWKRIDVWGPTAKHRKCVAVLFTVVLLAMLATFMNRGSSEPHFQGPENFMTFDGEDDCVLLKEFGFRESEPFTLEAWVNFQGSNKGALVAQGPIVVNCLATGNNQARFRLVVINQDETMFLMTAREHVERDQWNHVAITYDAERVRIFVNGRDQQLDIMPMGVDSEPIELPFPEHLVLHDIYPGSPFHIGALESRGRADLFRGQIGEFRYSSSVFYRGDFTPMRKLSISPSTEFLLQMSSENGKVFDRSQQQRVDTEL